VQVLAQGAGLKSGGLQQASDGWQAGETHGLLNSRLLLLLLARHLQRLAAAAAARRSLNGVDRVPLQAISEQAGLVTMCIRESQRAMLRR